MKSIALHPASKNDAPQILAWMNDFAALEGRASDGSALKAGRVLVISIEGIDAGYAVVGARELFLVPQVRRHGVGLRVMELLTRGHTKAVSH